MGFDISLPPHEQDAFGEQLDAAVQAQDTAPGTIPLSQSNLNLRDYLVRKAKEIMADAPIVAVHLVATISGHANDGNAVFTGNEVSPANAAPYFTIGVSAVPDAAVPVQQQPQTPAVVPGGELVQPAVVEEPAPAEVPAEEGDAVPSDAPVEPSVEPAVEESPPPPPPAPDQPDASASGAEPVPA